MKKRSDAAKVTFVCMAIVVVITVLSSLASNIDNNEFQYGKFFIEAIVGVVTSVVFVWVIAQIVHRLGTGKWIDFNSHRRDA